MWSGLVEHSDPFPRRLCPSLMRGCQGIIRCSDIVPNFAQFTSDAAFSPGEEYGGSGPYGVEGGVGDEEGDVFNTVRAFFSHLLASLETLPLIGYVQFFFSPALLFLVDQPPGNCFECITGFVV